MNKFKRSYIRQERNRPCIAKFEMPTPSNPPLFFSCTFSSSFLLPSLKVYHHAQYTPAHRHLSIFCQSFVFLDCNTFLLEHPYDSFKCHDAFQTKLKNKKKYLQCFRCTPKSSSPATISALYCTKVPNKLLQRQMRPRVPRTNGNENR